ncbi:MAG: hypothetical protein WBD40_04140 [Tepidisphaeraceae bacterium]
MNTLIPPLRPNYTVADFRAGQSIELRCDGSAGVPRFMHGERAVVVKATPKRLVVVRVNARDHRELRVKPSQIAIILEEPPI